MMATAAATASCCCCCCDADDDGASPALLIGASCEWQPAGDAHSTPVAD